MKNQIKKWTRWVNTYHAENWMGLTNYQAAIIAANGEIGQAFLEKTGRNSVECMGLAELYHI